MDVFQQVCQTKNFVSRKNLRAKNWFGKNYSFYDFRTFRETIRPFWQKKLGEVFKLHSNCPETQFDEDSTLWKVFFHNFPTFSEKFSVGL